MLHFFISSHHHRLTLLKVVTTVKERYDSFVYVMSFTHSFDTYLLEVSIKAPKKGQCTPAFLQHRIYVSKGHKMAHLRLDLDRERKLASLRRLLSSSLLLKKGR